MEKLFKLKQNKTTVRTEIIAGLTTFMTMAYIIMLNPNILVGFDQGGSPLWNGDLYRILLRYDGHGILGQ